MENEALRKFMEEWKQSGITYYEALLEQYLEAEALDVAAKDFTAGEAFRESVSAVDYEIVTTGNANISNLLDKEVEKKVQQLVNRIEKKAGKIISTEYMTFGNDGELNGRVEGEKATVTVQTITAGGHTIQKRHYRVLVNLLKIN